MAGGLTDLDVVLMETPDRLSRDLGEVTLLRERLNAAGCAIVTTTGDAFSMMPGR